MGLAEEGRGWLVIQRKEWLFFSIKPSTFRTLQHSQILRLTESGLRLVSWLYSTTNLTMFLKSIRSGDQRSVLFIRAARQLSELESFLFFWLKATASAGSNPLQSQVPLEMRCTKPHPSRMFIRSQILRFLIPESSSNSLASKLPWFLGAILSRKSRQRCSMEPFYFQREALSLELSCLRTMGVRGVLTGKVAGRSPQILGGVSFLVVWVLGRYAFMVYAQFQFQIKVSLFSTLGWGIATSAGQSS